MRGDFDGEDADVVVLEDEVVMGLGGDLYFGGGLRGEDSRREQQRSFHVRGL